MQILGAIGKSFVDMLLSRVDFLNMFADKSKLRKWIVSTQDNRPYLRRGKIYLRLLSHSHTPYSSLTGTEIENHVLWQSPVPVQSLQGFHWYFFSPKNVQSFCGTMNNFVVAGFNA